MHILYVASTSVPAEFRGTHLAKFSTMFSVLLMKSAEFAHAVG